MAEAQQPRGLFGAMNKFNQYVSHDFLGGPHVIKFAWIINFQKGATLPFVLALMYYFDNWSLGAWIYLGLHGSYGLIWLLKDLAMPDPKWESKVTIASGINAFVTVLGPYWLAPIILITGIFTTEPITVTPLLACICTIIYAVGVVIMMVADAQKYFTLKYKRGLITEGLFKHIRHPNYLGEMMVYGSFAALVQHWIPWAVLAWVWGSLFATNIYMKEISMSRYDEWADYKRRSGLLLPRIL